MTIGENIRKARKNAGLTQKQLAEKLDITQPTVAMFENDKTNIKYSTLEKIANKLNVSAYSLLKGIDPLQQGELFKSDAIEIIQSLNIEAVFEPNDTDYSAAIIDELEKKRSYIDLYDLLNSQGQDKAIERVEELTYIPKYKKDPEK